MENISDDHPLRHLFTGLVEHTFCTRVGVCDPKLTDYLSDLLVRFIHVDELAAIARAEEKGIEQIASALAVAMGEKPKSTEDRDRSMYRHIGDYTLFWAGVFPEQLRRRSTRDLLLEYVNRGKKSYAIVSKLEREDGPAPASLFRHLSEDFEYCLYGLGLVRKEWEHAPPGGGELLL